MLRIAVASTGRFHMFDLARQMVAAGNQVKLLTGYPMMKVDPDLRPVTATHSRWVLVEHALTRLSGRVPAWLPFEGARDFGAWVARHLEDAPTDVFDALDGSGLEAGRICRDRGGVWVCNRGSAHILTQKRLLEEEHSRWGAATPRHYFWPLHVDRCMAEYGGADVIMVPSHFAARTFVEQGVPAAKIQVCPYGVDLSLFRPKPKQDARFRVLFVGILSLQKGVGDLMEAVRDLVRKGKVELWLAGRMDNARDVLRRDAGLFRYLGVIPRERLSSVYSECSVLVLPSIQDGFGLVQAQAMACGVPVIATTNTGAADLYTDGIEGFLVPIRDAQAIREKIEWMLDCPERREMMGRAALRRVQALDGWKAYGERVNRLYHHFFSEKNRNSAETDGRPHVIPSLSSSSGG